MTSTGIPTRIGNESKHDNDLLIDFELLLIIAEAIIIKFYVFKARPNKRLYIVTITEYICVPVHQA